MKALLVGGPKNGTVLHIKAGFAVLTEHEGKRYEYLRRIFVWELEGKEFAWPVWIHGIVPADEEILAMIRKEEIDPEFERLPEPR